MANEKIKTLSQEEIDEYLKSKKEPTIGTYIGSFFGFIAALCVAACIVLVPLVVVIMCVRYLVGLF